MTNATKRTLANAMVRVMAKKNLEKITVNDIVSACGASRQTFYNHFNDKYDLVNWIYKDDHRTALASIDLGVDWRDGLYQSYMVFWKHRKFYQNAASGIGVNSFMNFLWKFCNDFYERSIITRYGEEEISDTLRFAIRFNDYGAVNMFRDWLFGGLNRSPKEMANLLIDCMPEIMKQYFD